MKIAHIVCTYPPYFGGMGNSVFQLASALAGRGHDVEVFTPRYYEEKEIRAKEAPPARTHEPELQEQIETVHRLTPDIQYGNAARLPQIGHELDDFDVAHLHYPFYGTANLVRTWKLRNPDKPLVLTYHMDTRGTGWKGVAFKLYSKYWMPRILSSADACIASSFDYIEASDAREVYASNKGAWIEIPFGVDTNRFFPENPPVALVESLNLSSEWPVLLFVGGMDAAHYFKGVDVALRSLAILKSEGAPVQMVCVGDGELRPRYEERAKMLGISESVRFVGRVSDDDLPEYYRLADMLVLPSTTRNEAFGMVLLEAFASGVPVVASDLPGVRTVAKDAGITVRPNDPDALANAIGGYFTEDTDRNHWRARARAVAEEKYSLEKIAEMMEMLYKGLAGE